MSRSKEYRLRQKSKKPPPSPNVLFVPNMKQGTTEEQLIEHFR
jgi:RNA recognition motif-containing protein